MGAGASKNLQSEKAKHAAHILDAVQQLIDTDCEGEFGPELFKRRVKQAAAESKLQGHTDLEVALTHFTDEDLTSLSQYMDNAKGQKEVAPTQDDLNLEEIAEELVNVDGNMAQFGTGEEEDATSVLSYDGINDDDNDTLNEAADEDSDHLLDGDIEIVEEIESGNSSPSANDRNGSSQLISNATTFNRSLNTKVSMAKIYPIDEIEITTDRTSHSPPALTVRSTEDDALKPRDASMGSRGSNPSHRKHSHHHDAMVYPSSSSPSEIPDDSHQSNAASHNFNNHLQSHSSQIGRSAADAIRDLMEDSHALLLDLESMPTPTRGSSLTNSTTSLGSPTDTANQQSSAASAAKAREERTRKFPAASEEQDRRNETLMGLQRQKIWSYAQNVQLQCEVDVLQQQLEQLEVMEKELEKSAKKDKTGGGHVPKDSKDSTSHSSDVNHSPVIHHQLQQQHTTSGSIRNMNSVHAHEASVNFGGASEAKKQYSTPEKQDKLSGINNRIRQAKESPVDSSNSSDRTHEHVINVNTNSHGKVTSTTRRRPRGGIGSNYARQSTGSVTNNAGAAVMAAHVLSPQLLAAGAIIMAEETYDRDYDPDAKSVERSAHGGQQHTSANAAAAAVSKQQQQQVQPWLIMSPPPKDALRKDNMPLDSASPLHALDALAKISGIGSNSHLNTNNNNKHFADDAKGSGGRRALHPSHPQAAAACDVAEDKLESNAVVEAPTVNERARGKNALTKLNMRRRHTMDESVAGDSEDLEGHHAPTEAQEHSHDSRVCPDQTAYDSAYDSASEQHMSSNIKQAAAAAAGSGGPMVPRRIHKGIRNGLKHRHNAASHTNENQSCNADSAAEGADHSTDHTSNSYQASHLADVSRERRKRGTSVTDDITNSNNNNPMQQIEEETAGGDVCSPVSPRPHGPAVAGLSHRQGSHSHMAAHNRAAAASGGVLHHVSSNHHHPHHAAPTGRAVAGKVSAATEHKPKLWSSELDARWGEVGLLVRRPLNTEADMQYCIAAAEAGLMFTDQLNAVAKSLGVLRGTLSRWLLPFDNNTRIDEQCSTPHSVVESMPDALRGKLTERQIHYLVAGANGVRRLVRIKIADDNDLEQAREALKTAVEFFRQLDVESSASGITQYQLLEQIRDQ